nr:uncharacterized protein LOC113459253 [Zonotrichia albicollis]
MKPLSPAEQMGEVTHLLLELSPPCLLQLAEVRHPPHHPTQRRKKVIPDHPHQLCSCLLASNSLSLSPKMQPLPHSSLSLRGELSVVVSEGKALPQPAWNKAGESKPRSRQILCGNLRCHEHLGRFFKGASESSWAGAVAPSEPLGSCIHTHTGAKEPKQGANSHCPSAARGSDTALGCHMPGAPSVEQQQLHGELRSTGQELTQSMARRISQHRLRWSSSYVRCCCFFLMLSPFSQVPGSDRRLPWADSETVSWHCCHEQRDRAMECWALPASSHRDLAWAKGALALAACQRRICPLQSHLLLGCGLKKGVLEYL